MSRGRLANVAAAASGLLMVLFFALLVGWTEVPAPEHGTVGPFEPGVVLDPSQVEYGTPPGTFDCLYRRFDQPCYVEWGAAGSGDLMNDDR